MFFTRSEELTQTRFVPLIVDAVVDLGGTPTRPEVIARAIKLGRFTPEELAVPSHTKQDRETGRGAVAGRLRYAIWQARTNGVLLSGETGGQQVLTDKGRAMIGAPTGYPELDARRLPPGGGSHAGSASATLRPYVPPHRDSSDVQSLRDALPRSGFYDIDSLDRRTAEHHTLQGEAERWLSALGWHVGLSPEGSAIVADLIAERDGRWVVVEVKTLDEDAACPGPSAAAAWPRPGPRLPRATTPQQSRHRGGDRCQRCSAGPVVDADRRRLRRWARMGAIRHRSYAAERRQADVSH